MTAVLELKGISKSFSGYKATSNASFCLEKGEVHALLGENGAGKSSMMNVAAGLYATDEGDIFLNGRRTRINGPLDAMHLGIGMVHQHYKLAKAFSALENIMLSQPGGGFRELASQVTRKVEQFSEAMNFKIDMKQPVGQLSIAEQQRIEILKVLVGGAKILILDEPTAVLTDVESDNLLNTIKKLSAEGTSVVLVSHKLGEVKKFADRVTIMRGGETITTVDTAEKTPQELAVLIVGEPVEQVSIPSKDIGEEMLHLHDVSVARGDGHRTLNRVNFSARSGEIYGIAGVSGNGQSELAEVLMGICPVSGGDIEIEGAGHVTHAPVKLRRAMGVVSIPADRHSYGLAGGLSVADNYAVAGVVAGRFGGWTRVNSQAIREAASGAVSQYDVQGVHSLGQRVSLLSGGNAQKMVIAREFAKSPRIVLAHSPSRGLDVRATAAVHASLRKARNEGAAVLLISEDLDEILYMSDRIGVMTRGSIAAEFDCPADRHKVGEAMVGHD